MKKFIVIIILPLLLISQYNYALASCYMCTEGTLKDVGFIETNSGKIELLFNKIMLVDEFDDVNLNQALTLQYFNTEIIYVPMYNGNTYFFIEKEGILLGAVDLNEGQNEILLPDYIKPEGAGVVICHLTCFMFFAETIASLIACPLLVFAIISSPSDEELREALFRSCLNGITGIDLTFLCLYSFCW